MKFVDDKIETVIKFIISDLPKLGWKKISWSKKSNVFQEKLKYNPVNVGETLAESDGYHNLTTIKIFKTMVFQNRRKNT